MFQDHRESKDEVKDVVDGQTRQVAVSRRLHRLARQNHDVDDVADTAERYDGRNEQFEGNCLEAVEKQLTLRQCGVVILLLMMLVCPRRPVAVPVFRRHRCHTCSSQ